MKVKASEFISNGMREYTYATIEERSIPSMEDGLKPVQRYILYAMHANNIRKFTKSANVSSETMKFSPHADSYEAIVNMTTKNKQHIQYIDGEGSFGSATSKNTVAAASRYTSCKLGKNSDILLKELNNGGVDFIDSYDGEKIEPIILPATAPTVLFNYTIGIAVAYATSILPFNSAEIYQLLEEKLKDKPLSMFYPDFSNGCSIEKDEEELKKLYKTGKAKFILSSVYEIKGKSIIIKAIPENVTEELIIKEVRDLMNDKIIPDIKDIVNNSGINGLEIEIVTKRNPEETIQLLLQKTSLRKAISANTNVLFRGKLREFGIDEILDRWIEWRKEVIKRELNTYLDKVNKEMDKLETILSVKKNKDKVIPIIMNSKNVEKDLSEWYNEEQIKLILSMKLQQLTKKDERKIYSKLDELQNLIRKIASVEINDLILKAYKETVPMLDRKSEIIKPLEKIIVKQPKNKQFTFDFKNGFIVKGEKELHDNERFVVLTKDNTLYTYGKNDLKDKLFVTEKEVIYSNIVSEKSEGDIVILFSDNQIVKLPINIFYIKKKINKDFLHGDIQEVDPENIDVNKLQKKKTRKSKGVKLNKKIYK